jgi:hypothetical protein
MPYPLRECGCCKVQATIALPSTACKATADSWRRWANRSALWLLKFLTMSRSHRLRYVPVESVGKITKKDSRCRPPTQRGISCHDADRRTLTQEQEWPTESARNRSRNAAGRSPRRELRARWLGSSQTRIVGGTAAWVPVSRRCNILEYCTTSSRVGATVLTNVSAVAPTVDYYWCAGCADHVVRQTCAGLSLTHDGASTSHLCLEYYSVDYAQVQVSRSRSVQGRTRFSLFMRWWKLHAVC